jgi:glycosyltransferase involved in cell wall biosynthesis
VNVSIVIPAYNEDESLPELSAWIEQVMLANKYSYEIIFIDDGSRDNTWNVIEQLAAKNNNIRAIKFQRNYGKSPALNEGFILAQGDYVVTMDADLQDSPEEIPGLIATLEEGNYDLVSGWKKVRHDNKFTKNLPSKIYNGVTGRLSGIKLHDMNCGLKIYRKNVIKSIEIFGEMHRYIPVLAKSAGFNRIGEKVVIHQKRKYGESKFGMERFVNGFLDLSTVLFISKYGRKPMHLFGLWGTLLFLLGFSITIYLIISKFFWDAPITNRVPFYLAMTVMILGTQFFLAGFIGELISRNSADRNQYLIEKKL